MIGGNRPGPNDGVITSDDDTDFEVPPGVVFTFARVFVVKIEPIIRTHNEKTIVFQGRRMVPVWIRYG